MSNLIDIKDLKKEFLEKTKLKEIRVFAEKQQEFIQNLIDQNKALVDKVNHLESMLLSSKSNVVRMEITSEELICMEQIDLLRGKSASRELSLDEVKRLDLLIKNLRLIREESTEVINTASYSTDISEDTLVAIATNRRKDAE